MAAAATTVTYTRSTSSAQTTVHIEASADVEENIASQRQDIRQSLRQHITHGTHTTAAQDLMDQLTSTRATSYLKA